MEQEERKPYNSTSEPENSEVISASLWELLRRNAEFRVIAGKWIASKSFREAHTQTPDYRDFCRLLPRCALDWMLSIEQRLALARFQIEKRIWELGKNRNFGPIVWRWRRPQARMSRKTAYEAVEVRPMRDSPGPITTAMSWNDVPEPFKIQFRYSSQPRRAAFASINKALAQTALDLGIIARRLQVGPRVEETESITNAVFEHAAELHQLAGNYRIYRIAHGDYSNAVFKRFFDSIKKDFSGEYGTIFSGRKYDAHGSYLGTAEDWKWFLEAESRGLEINKSADQYKLAILYSEDLRHRKIRGKAPPQTKAPGHTGSSFSSKTIKGRRSAVKRHVLNIQKWIKWMYQPLASPSAKPVF